MGPPIRVVIFDHDYTVSRPTPDGDQRYLDAFRNGLQRLLKDGGEAFNWRWGNSFERIFLDPGQHGFIFDEKIGIVAAATSDVMMLTHAVGWDYVRRFRTDIPHARYRGMAYDLYKAAYPLLGMTPRPELPEVLNELKSLGVRATIATNSAKGAVQEALASGLGHQFQWFIDEVEGGASKFEIDPEWDAVPSQIEVPGLARPRYLRRRKYAEVLIRACGEVPMDQAMVVGDNDELDLDVAEALRAQVGLLQTIRTPAWSREWAQALSRGQVRRRHLLPSLRDVVDIVRASHVAA
jgi:phosphoglycolate phosphatase-like HAD superfamily hydrolase